jgi:hypothetical protein
MKISTDQLGNRVVPKGGGGMSPSITYTAGFWTDIYIDDVSDFPPFQIFAP